MSSSSKNNRLSLTKKRRSNNTKETPNTPTILSLFKKQRERQSCASEGGEPNCDTDDVVITKVVKSTSGTIMTNADTDSNNLEAPRADTNKMTRLKRARESSNSDNEAGVSSKSSKLRRSGTGSISDESTTQQEKTDRKTRSLVSERDSSSTRRGKLSLHKSNTDSGIEVKKRKMKEQKERSKSFSGDEKHGEMEDIPERADVKHRSGWSKTAKLESHVADVSERANVEHSPHSIKGVELESCDGQTDSTHDTEESVQSEEGDILIQQINKTSSSKRNLTKKGKQSTKTDSSNSELLKESFIISNKTIEKRGKQSHGVDSNNSRLLEEEISVNKVKLVKKGKQSCDIGSNKSEVLEEEDNVNKKTFVARQKESRDIDSDKSEVYASVSTTINDTEEVEGDTEGDGVEETLYKVPYYLENFHTILDSVLGDQENYRLFDDEDLGYITAFRNMSEPCQKLYVRIFGRKLSWLPMAKLKYPEISDDIPKLVDELITAGFLKSGEELSELPVILEILPAPDLKTLAKSFHINTASTPKPKLVELLLKKSQQSSIGSMFTGSKTASTLNAMIKRAKTHLGKACRLQEVVRAVFIRLLMLFCLYNTNFDEESGSVGQNQLFQMLMVNVGRVTYPNYVVNKKKPVFKDREAVIRFETALQFEMDLLHLVEKGKWNDAHVVYEQARQIGEPILTNKHFRKWDTNLPEYLRLYTAGSIYIRIANQGVEILQRQKKYTEAVKLLEDMLKQKLYCNQYRGHWYERLALNLDAHLKKPTQSLDVIKRGLADEHVRSGRKLAIYERAKKICEAPKSKYSARMKEFIHDPVLPTPETTIEGMVISDATSMGMKYQFVMQGDTDSVTLCAVEELVLEYYKNHGYPEGLHAEGSIIANLFTLYFWDILYMDIEDVFQGPFQSCPLDLYTQDFYKQRQETVDKRLEWIKTRTEQELLDEIKKIWENHSGKMCIGMNWEKFTGPETHQGLVSCMNGDLIAGILGRYVKDPRHTRSGFPDLTLWNTETKSLKISEVKGPNDRLSYKQILWIDHLLKLGIDAEVCYVKAVGSKKIQPKSSK